MRVDSNILFILIDFVGNLLKLACTFWYILQEPVCVALGSRIVLVFHQPIMVEMLNVHMKLQLPLPLPWWSQKGSICKYGCKICLQ